MRKCLPKSSNIVITNVLNRIFLNELHHCLVSTNINNYNEFENIFENILQRHAPLKTKYVRANNKPHISKNLRKAIMKRSQLKSLANKTNTPEDVANYKRQRNLVVTLNREEKKSFYNSINHKAKPRNFYKKEMTLNSQEKTFIQISIHFTLNRKLMLVAN